MALGQVNGAMGGTATGAVMMAIKLLDGLPYAITADPESMRVYTAVADKLGATVEHAHNPITEILPEETQARFRSIVVRPAGGQPDETPAAGIMHRP
jgi:hypothetical protein